MIPWRCRWVFEIIDNYNPFRKCFSSAAVLIVKGNKEIVSKANISRARRRRDEAGREEEQMGTFGDKFSRAIDGTNRE